jgi:YfiH family protein
VFYLDSNHFYRASELDAIPWLIHGFGTRHSHIPDPLATVKQIHSATCVAAEGKRGVLAQADAIIENTPGNAIAVKTADCIPVLLADERLRAVAAVHAGWRGTAAHIVQGAIDAMKQRYGTDPADLHAAIGPGIGACCYEVGPEVMAQFGAEGRGHLDLEAENRRQLEGAGVPPDRIYAAHLCTMCRSDEFHSFRRDREAAGRMYSFVGVGRVADPAQ